MGLAVHVRRCFVAHLGGVEAYKKNTPGQRQYMGVRHHVVRHKTQCTKYESAAQQCKRAYNLVILSACLSLAVRAPKVTSSRRLCTAI